MPKKKIKRPEKVSDGHELWNHLVHLTGLSASTIKKELQGILDRKNIDVKNLTLNQLRSVAASYLREIMGHVLERNRRQDSSSTH